MADRWTAYDPRWNALNPYERAAAMAIMEADKRNPTDARNAAGAMVNRASKSGEDLYTHVGKRIYQPSIEPAQQARLPSILKSPQHQELTKWVERRWNGQEEDPVNGATHFLAPPQTMLNLEAKNPRKYRNWGPNGANWTGYDPGTGQYKGTVLADQSHHFLAPEGAHSRPGKPQAPFVAPMGAPVTLAADRSPEPPPVQGGTQPFQSVEPPPEIRQRGTNTASVFGGYRLPPSATQFTPPGEGSPSLNKPPGAVDLPTVNQTSPPSRVGMFAAPGLTAPAPEPVNPGSIQAPEMSYPPEMPFMPMPGPDGETAVASAAPAREAPPDIKPIGAGPADAEKSPFKAIGKAGEGVAKAMQDQNAPKAPGLLSNPEKAQAEMRAKLAALANNPLFKNSPFKWGMA